MIADRAPPVIIAMDACRPCEVKFDRATWSLSLSRLLSHERCRVERACTSESCSWFALPLAEAATGHHSSVGRGAVYYRYTRRRPAVMTWPTAVNVKRDTVEAKERELPLVVYLPRLYASGSQFEIDSDTFSGQSVAICGLC